MNGLVIVDKPIGYTSFDMVAKMRKEYNQKKVGHIGTLDPMASGVLPILLGEATKLSDYLMLHDKEYVANLKLGISTDTGDSEGKIIEEKEIPNLNNIDLNKLLQDKFIGKQMQVPPMYSAIKINGKKMYELAREGKKIDIPPREIEILKIEIIELNIIENEITFKVECSKGTYIRVLCEDIAKELNTCGYMKALRRTRVGKFKIEDAGKFIDFEDILDVKKISINDILKNQKTSCKNIINYEKMSDSEEKKENTTSLTMDGIMKKLLNGVVIHINENDGLVNLYKDDKFIGIGEIKNNELKRKIII